MFASHVHDPAYPLSQSGLSRLRAPPLGFIITPFLPPLHVHGHDFTHKLPPSYPTPPPLLFTQTAREDRRPGPLALRGLLSLGDYFCDDAMDRVPASDRWRRVEWLSQLVRRRGADRPETTDRHPASEVVVGWMVIMCRVVEDRAGTTERRPASEGKAGVGVVNDGDVRRRSPLLRGQLVVTDCAETTERRPASKRKGRHV